MRLEVPIRSGPLTAALLRAHRAGRLGRILPLEALEAELRDLERLHQALFPPGEQLSPLEGGVPQPPPAIPGRAVTEWYHRLVMLLDLATGDLDRIPEGRRFLRMMIRTLGLVSEALMFDTSVEDHLTQWALLDHSPRGDGETWAGAVATLALEAGWPEPVRRGLEALARSTRGVWRVERGANPSEVVLRDVVTGVECRCARPPEIPDSVLDDVWIARLLPPPAPGASTVVEPVPMITLPDTSPDDARDWVDSLLSDFPPEQRPQVYPLLMKYGPAPDYWFRALEEGLLGERGAARHLFGHL